MKKYRCVTTKNQKEKRAQHIKITIRNRLLKNTASLYLLTAAKYIFPLVTLPYLTRVLSIDYYGTITYVKAYMIYAAMIMDFGFNLSATKQIVSVDGDLEKTGYIIAEVTWAKVFLIIPVLITIVGMMLFVDLLRGFALYVLLSLLAVILTALLPDYYFRGIQQMQILSVRFVICKCISTILTLLFVKSDADIIFIPLLDVATSILAILLSAHVIRKNGVPSYPTRVAKALYQIKSSLSYFFSNAASTGFSALSTLLIGIILDAKDVAYWGVALQIIAIIQALYDPIITSIYPYMVKERDVKIIKKTLLIFMPLILCGCGVCVWLSPQIIKIIAGKKYINAVDTFRGLIPVLFFSFPAMLLGWPTLGAINCIKGTTLSTVLSGAIQVVLLGLLICTKQFSLVGVVVVRNVAEVVLFGNRLALCIKNRKLFMTNVEGTKCAN